MNIWRCLSDWKEGNNTHYVMVQSPKLLKPAMCLVSLIDLYLYKKTFETHEVFFFQCKVPFLGYHNWRMSKESLPISFLLMNIRFKSSCLQSWFFFSSFDVHFYPMIILYQKSTSTVQTTEFTFTFSLILRGLNHQG